MTWRHSGAQLDIRAQSLDQNSLGDTVILHSGCQTSARRIKGISPNGGLALAFADPEPMLRVWCFCGLKERQLAPQSCAKIVAHI